MKIILSPAKKMKIDEVMEFKDFPLYLDKTEEILHYLKQLNHQQLKTLWKCNDKMVDENIERIQNMNLKSGLTPAIFSYEGIAYQYMAPHIFEQHQYIYLQSHLRILSAFYGVLKPMDGVKPYRLEMQAKASVAHTKNLYEFWGDCLYKGVKDESGIIINLASKEYSKCIEKYLTNEDTFITITFVEEVNNKFVTKGTYAKMARGEMVRFMAENQIEDPQEIKKFNSLNYQFKEELSSKKEYVFERQK